VMALEELLALEPAAKGARHPYMWMTAVAATRRHASAGYCGAELLLLLPPLDAPCAWLLLLLPSTAANDELDGVCA